MDLGAAMVFLRALVVVIVVARLLRLLCRWFGQPEVVGEIAAGSLLGLTPLYGLLTRELFATTIRPALRSLSTALSAVGIGVVMFLAGRHPAEGGPRGRGRIAVVLSLGSMAVPTAARADRAAVRDGSHRDGAATAGHAPSPNTPAWMGRHNIFWAFPLGTVTLRQSTATLRARVLP